MKKLLLVLLLLIVAIPLAAQQDNVITDTAILSDVEAETTDEGVVITVRGDFPDSCTELGDISQDMEITGGTINLTVTVETSRPADAICAQVLTSFESSFLLDTSELSAGSYTLIVNGISSEITIDPTACPDVQEQTYLYTGQGICFLYPENYTELSADGFVMISIPRSNNAFLLVEISPEEKPLEDIQAVFDEAIPARFGAQDAFLLEDENIRQAYFVFEGNRYVFTFQASSDDPSEENLWEIVMNSLFFNSETIND